MASHSLLTQTYFLVPGSQHKSTKEGEKMQKMLNAICTVNSSHKIMVTFFCSNVHKTSWNRMWETLHVFCNFPLLFLYSLAEVICKLGRRSCTQFILCTELCIHKAFESWYYIQINDLSLKFTTILTFNRNLKRFQKKKKEKKSPNSKR